MEALELPLFPITNSIPSVKPVIKNQPVAEDNTVNPQATIDNLLNGIFPKQSEENNVIRTKRLLGKTAENISDEQIGIIVTEFQFLIDTWLDEYEKGVFNGMTLKEILNEA